MKKVNLVVIIIFINAFAYSLSIDSLKNILKRKDIHDTTKLRALCILSEKAPDGEWEVFNEQMNGLAIKKLAEKNSTELQNKYNNFLGYSYSNMGYIAQTQSDLDKAIKFFQKALDIFLKIGGKGDQASCYNSIGSVYNDRSEFSTAIEYYKKAIKTAEEVGAKSIASVAYNNLGLIFYRMGNIPLAVEYLYNNAKVQEQIGDDVSVSATYNNLGQILSRNGDTTKALEYMNKSLKIREKLGLKEGMAIVLNNMASIQGGKGRYKESLQLFNRSLQLKESINDHQGIALSYLNIARIYLKTQNYDSATIYCKKAIEILEKFEEKEEICNGYMIYGTILMNQNKLKEAEDYTKRAHEIAVEISNMEDIKFTSAQLFAIYKKLNKYDKALEMHELYMRTNDSLNSQVNKKAIYKKQLNYEYEIKAIADSIKVAEERKVSDLKLQQEKTQKYVLYVGLGIVMIFAFIMFNRFKVTQRQKKIIEDQKHIVEEKNREITDSINYAQKIQKTLLASQTFLNNNLQQYFVLFNPKDIVSGDFYWATNAHDKFYLAVADSTGHGVPGAFMSLLNISFLNEAINEKGYVHTNEVLNHTRQRLIQSLANEDQEGGNDGMDCSLLCFDFKSNILEFTCANNPILVIRNGQIIEHNADKMPVGKSPRQELSFTKTQFQLQKDDIVYAFTDGYPDQFGGPKGKKFKYKALCELLLNSSPKDLKLQQELLQKSFTVWKGELEQIDDVLVFGIKI